MKRLADSREDTCTGISLKRVIEQPLLIDPRHGVNLLNPRQSAGSARKPGPNVESKWAPRQSALDWRVMAHFLGSTNRISE